MTVPALAKPKTQKLTIKIDPPLKDYQISSLYNPARYVIIEASTKSGKTHACIIWLAQKAFQGQNGQNFWWVAPVYPQAEIAFRRMRDAIPQIARKVNESDLSITVASGAIIRFKTGEKPDNLYGEDVYACVIDEASRMREEAWHAIRSTITKTQGHVRIIGNVKGRNNWAYRLARRAEGGEKDFHYAKVIAADAVKAGILKQEEIDDARKVLPEQVFNELYLAIPSDDGGNPFGLKHILSCTSVLSTQPPVCFGVDLAKSVDWTVVIGLDSAGSVCVFDRFQGPWKEQIVRIKSLVRAYPTLVDSTGVGDPVVEELQRKNETGFSRIEGFKFTQESKQRIMEGLAVSIQQGRLHFPEGAIRSELESFEYEYTRTGVRYTAPEGMHDDCVCALALANSLMQTRALRPVSAQSGNGLVAAPQPIDDWM